MCIVRFTFYHINKSSEDGHSRKKYLEAKCDVLQLQLWRRGSGYETRATVEVR